MQIELTKLQKKHIAALNITTAFLIGTAVDLYVPSFPHIASYFHVTRHLVQLTIGLYLLGYGFGQLFLGILSDSLGRRKILLGSATFFILVSFLAAISPNIYFLNIYRFFQGLGLAGIGASMRALLTDCFSDVDLAKAMALLATGWAIGPIIGPYIGGYLQHYFSWRADFYFFTIYGCVVFLISALILPETNVQKQPLYPRKIMKSIRTILSEPAFILTVIFLSLAYSTVVMFNIIGPFLIQNVLHFSVVAYGKISLFMGFGYFLGNLINRQMIRYFNPLTVVTIGLSGAVFAALTMLILAVTCPITLYIIIFPAFVIFLLFGLVAPNMMAKALELFPAIAGTSSALFGFVIASGVFLMTILATTLPTTSQTPMTITYVIVTCVCLILFFACKKRLTRRLHEVP